MNDLPAAAVASRYDVTFGSPILAISVEAEAVKFGVGERWIS